MARTLLSSGLPTALVSCIGLDDDGTTLRDFKRSLNSTWNGSAWTNNSAEMTVTATGVGTGSWKGATLPYFTCGGSGGTVFGVAFNAAGAGKPVINIGSGSPGACFLFLLHSIDTSSNFTKFVNEHGAATDGLKLTGTPQKQVMTISSTDGSASTTTVGTGKQLIGHNIEYDIAANYYYGLESGSAAADGSWDNGGRGGDGRIVSTVGGFSGQGWCAPEIYFALIFNRILTQAEVQSIHNDPLGTLFQGNVNASPTPSGAASTGTLGTAQALARPAPPYTLISVTG